MSKVLDLNKTVAELVNDYPEVKDIMADLGFKDITKPAALVTVGKIMTIPKGASIKDIELSKVIERFEAEGFEVVKGGSQSKAAPVAAHDAVETSSDNQGASSTADNKSKEGRAELLQSYVRRLSNGEDLESVRKDFVANFKDVDALEIANAEQALIKGGVPVAEVQKLCDVHSALFHGATKEERIAAAERQVNKEAAAMLERHKNMKKNGGVADRNAAKSKMADMAKVTGNPIRTFFLENEAIEKHIQLIREAVGSGDNDKISEEFRKMRGISAHYSKKGDLIYPILKTKYDVTGPSDVMWGVDDEIRDEIRTVAGMGSLNDELIGRISDVITRAEEMIYKENNILFPICVQFFSHEDWLNVYREIPNYDPCFISEYDKWEDGDKALEATEEAERAQVSHDEVVLPGGSMTLAQLEAVLDTIPMELTFVDENNINRFFNDGEKLFKRPKAAIGREVFSCHPPKVEAIVRQILDDFRNGLRDSVEVWHNMKGEPVLVRYIAVRDKKGNYVGTLECVQKMGFAKEHFEEE